MDTLNYSGLRSVHTGKLYEETGWLLAPEGESEPTLLRAEYKERKFMPRLNDSSLYRYASWLPIRRELVGSCAPVTYKSEALAKHLGLPNLYITLSGYHPKIVANMPTCSFKETEAYSVCARLKDGTGQRLVVASAGNTAKAFARVCTENNIPLVLCVPEDSLPFLYLDKPLGDTVKVFATRSGSDYFDAIQLSDIIASQPGFLAEGGAKNVARRDGMGTTLLSAVEVIGKLPKYYFQAVGSGTGAIAVWENAMRLIEDGRYGDSLPCLMVSQNAPFLPMYEAWKAHSRALLPYDDNQARKDAETILAKVLSNRKPPYSLHGGLYDALEASKGDVLAVTNEAQVEAQALFKKHEGIDIYSAAGVALASLIQAIEGKQIDTSADIMLNITGAGEELYKSTHELHYFKPTHVFDYPVNKEEVLSVLEKVYKTNA